MTSPAPTEIKLRRAERVLELNFPDGRHFVLPCEYLRVYSPSAEVRGHGPGQETVQAGKRNVAIDTIEPVGNYAVKLSFDDGHDSGLYSWELLYDLGVHQDEYWKYYLEQLAAAGATRDKPT